ncbi:MAG: transporter substrate-binding domain-containing protein [Desulfovibrionaceae bacterium]|jgi:polar amino acid transport system substrate-binding protein|nr:transporter substrate-binding domain-containing protein [Desulfovibrionaceae bacterium]
MDNSDMRMRALRFRTLAALLPGLALILVLALPSAAFPAGTALAADAPAPGAGGAAPGPQGLHIACDIWPPYQFSAQGRLTGFSTEVVRAVLARLHAPIASLESFPWHRALDMLLEGRTDALFSANWTRRRAVLAHYPAEPLVKSPWVVWTRADAHIAYKEISDLAPLRVGVVNGYSYTSELWVFLQQHGNYEAVADDETNFRKLAMGRVDAVVAELHNGRHLLAQLGLTGIEPREDAPIKTDGLYILFAKNRVPEAFVRRFSEELRRFRASSDYSALRKAFLTPAPAPARPDAPETAAPARQP